MAVKLSSKAYSALRVIECTEYKQRAIALEQIEEWSFALILYWSQIEAALKLARYGYDIEKWPDRLDFLRSNWGPLKRLKSNSSSKYDQIFGAVGTSLKNRRNDLVHEGINLSDAEYSKYLELARWAILNLEKEVPKIEQLREKKRRLVIASAGKHV